MDIQNTDGRVNNIKILMITENWKETKMLINLETTEQCIAQGEETTKIRVLWNCALKVPLK